MLYMYLILVAFLLSQDETFAGVVAMHQVQWMSIPSV